MRDWLAAIAIDVVNVVDVLKTTAATRFFSLGYAGGRRSFIRVGRITLSSRR